jgi:hypothetical protein
MPTTKGRDPIFRYIWKELSHEIGDRFHRTPCEDDTTSGIDYFLEPLSRIKEHVSKSDGIVVFEREEDTAIVFCVY